MARPTHLELVCADAVDRHLMLKAIILPCEGFRATSCTAIETLPLCSNLTCALQVDIEWGIFVGFSGLIVSINDWHDSGVDLGIERTAHCGNNVVESIALSHCGDCWSRTGVLRTHL
jgi:hypothetical protein